MEHRVSFGSIGLWLAISLAAGSAGGQLYVESGVGFNIFEGDFTISNNAPVCGDMSHGGDVFVEHDLELGGQLYLAGLVYLEGEAGEGSDGDQYIYFYDEDSRTDEYLTWDDGEALFELSDSLRIRGESTATHIDVVDAEKLVIGVDSPYYWFLADSDNSVGWAHFNWARNSVGNSHRLMALVEENGGDLSIGGTYKSGGVDLAESFWRVGDLAPGELVAADPQRPGAVRASAEAYDRRLVGVVSERPGVDLGGGVISVDALRRNWGDEAVLAFEQAQPALEDAVYAGNRELQTELLRLHSQTSYEQHLLSLEAERAAVAGAAPPTDDGQVPLPAPRRSSPGSLAERYAQALSDHRQRVEDLTLRRFFRERFVSVALVGRVPVKVSAGSGAVSVGDPLTASAVPGVAMKATRPGPVIGIALEPLDRGEGTIQVLVDRGWYGGERQRLLSDERRAPRRQDALLADLLAENARLAARLSALENLVRGLAPAPRSAVSTEVNSGS